MADVFISYSRHDQDKIKALVRGLQSLDLSVWLDTRTKTGAAWRREVTAEVRRAASVIVCWSPNSIKSEWVIEEADEGRRRNALVAARIAGGKGLPLPMPFGAVQTADLENWNGALEDNEWRRLVERVGELCRRPDLLSWGKLDPDTPASDLEKWLKQYPTSPLVSTVRVRVEQRHKLELEQQADEEKRKSEAAQDRKRAAESLAEARKRKEEELRAQHEQEEQARRAQLQLEETQRRVAEARARQSESERLLMQERLQRDNEAAENFRKMAEQARKSAAIAEQSEREARELIDAMERAEARALDARIRLEAQTAQQREQRRAEAARIAATAEPSAAGRRGRSNGLPPWVVRVIGASAAAGFVIALLVAFVPPVRSMIGGAVDGLTFGAEAEAQEEEALDAGASSQLVYAGADGANVRAAPGDRRVLVRVTPGTPLTVLARAEAGEYTWFRVELASGQIGYVREDVVSTEPSQAAVQPFAASRTFVAGAEGANVRSAPQMGASIYVFLDPGAPLDVTGRITIAGQTWYRVRFGGGREGFVRDDVVERASSVVARSAVVQVSATPPAQPQLAVEPFTPRMPLVAGLDGANVRQRPATSAAVVLRVSAGDPLQVTGRVRQDNRIWYRVVLRDGRVGFVREDVTAVASPAAVRTAPRTIDPRTVTWLRRPSRADMLRVYPRGAFTRRQEGSVDLECLVRADGRLENCTVVRPDSIAVFSDAALRLVGEFRMDAQLGDATNAAGRRVRVTVDFRVAN